MIHSIISPLPQEYITLSMVIKKDLLYFQSLGQEVSLTEQEFL
jgi:hypothetical protein